MDRQLNETWVEVNSARGAESEEGGKRKKIERKDKPWCVRIVRLFVCLFFFCSPTIVLARPSPLSGTHCKNLIFLILFVSFHICCLCARMHCRGQEYGRKVKGERRITSHHSPLSCLILLGEPGTLSEH